MLSQQLHDVLHTKSRINSKKKEGCFDNEVIQSKEIVYNLLLYAVLVIWNFKSKISMNKMWILKKIPKIHPLKIERMALSKNPPMRDENLSLATNF